MKFIDLLAPLTANRPMQKLARKIGQKALYLQGFGSGTKVADSGEKTVFEFIKSRYSDQESKVIFDVGANKGQFAESVEEKLTGVKYLLHCFEPSQVAFGEITRKFSRKEHIQLNNFALSDQCQTAKLYSNFAGSGIASLAKRNLDFMGIDVEAALEEVTVDTLDNYCSSQSISRIDLLKIDVEGFELNVLRGATQMLRERKIRVVLFEFGGTSVDTHTFFQDYYYFLKDTGMKSLFRLIPPGRLWEVSNYSDDLECFRTSNYLAVFE